MADSMRILLVEDNPSDLELTLHALRQEHIANDVTVARDGAEALELLLGNGESPKAMELSRLVVLLDLKLPKVDGLDVLRRMKADERTRGIPVIVLTSSREESDMVESYALGVNSYIVKPVDFDQFKESVKQVGLYWLLLNQLP